ncbi:23S rRNA (uracil(1939)-C(5))-methyltransferase RlmD [Granulicella sp. WH15]|uniref:23S rRNA (uracil(1939)-C(5))-methyltransferase RlmD n=1 Tax=Granulicella sp. WH15 TaxID=2602070 RepID=UPI001366BA40|nr:23S rRNA (uracil(1939)-C(5))-methyltransferase RlmD [Granulicella sp. WH15]QHN05063.1 23S rRNA (uracil(1939)-C(5))-methyltransferase RlmD [Granulicella sp. WH15]
MALRIERMKYGGAGVGVDATGAETDVPFTLPGELVDLAVTDSVQVVEASAQRVEPECRHFGSCGGCQYQHASYPAQVEIKSGILREILSQAGAGPVPEIELRTGEPWGYRNRVRMRVQALDGQLRVGHSRRSSNEFLPIEECPIAAPVLWRAAEALIQLAAEDAVVRRWLEHVAEVEFFCSADQARVQMALFLRDADVARNEPFTVFCEKVKALLPEMVGANAEIDPELSRRARRSWPGATWGAAGLVYEAAGAKYWVSRGAFFQVNRFLVDEMVALATAGRSGQLAWDLFAGVGLFSRGLAGGFAEVVAVEGNPVAAGDLAKLAKNVKAVEGATVDFLRRAVLERERPELIVMDPPRAGAGAEGCGLLGRIGAPALVYVSCDPVTLGRDLAVLARAGYGMERVWMVDMFPQTFHLETVVWLRKDAA